MTKGNAFLVLAMVLAFGMAGCATAQPKEPQTMLIDKIPVLKWEPQKTLAEGQYPEQQVMVEQIGQLLKGKYRVTKSRFFEMQPDNGDVFLWLAAKGALIGILTTDFHLHQVFENSTAELPPTPYLSAWKTQEGHPEYVAVSMLWLSGGNNTLLGYFELESK